MSTIKTNAILDAAGGNTATVNGTLIPASGVTLVSTDAAQTLTNKTLTSPTINGATISGSTMSGSTVNGGTIARGTAWTYSTPVSSVSFTGIPSWAKRVTVMLAEVSTNGTSGIAVQVGTSGGFATSGYVSTSNATNQANGTYGVSSTTNFQMRSGLSATDTVSVAMTLTLLNGNLWVQNHSGKSSTSIAFYGGGSVSLSAALDRVQVVALGTDTFDAGSINIMWEG